MGISYSRNAAIGMWILAAFIAGWASAALISSNPQEGIAVPRAAPMEGNQESALGASAGSSAAAAELPSPQDWIQESQIQVYENLVQIDVKGAEWATFTDTNSMDPVIDAGANAIEVRPNSAGQVRVGDIVSYRPSRSEGTVIHRVIRLGNDSEGWYAVMKGDNNPEEDPERVRFRQIERVVVAIVY